MVFRIVWQRVDAMHATLLKETFEAAHNSSYKDLGGGYSFPSFFLTSRNGLSTDVTTGLRSGRDISSRGTFAGPWIELSSLRLLRAHSSYTRIHSLRKDGDINWTELTVNRVSNIMSARTSKQKEMLLARLPHSWNPSKDYRESHRGTLKVDLILLLGL